MPCMCGGCPGCLRDQGWSEADIWGVDEPEEERPEPEDEEEEFEFLWADFIEALDDAIETAVILATPVLPLRPEDFGSEADVPF